MLQANLMAKCIIRNAHITKSDSLVSKLPRNTASKTFEKLMKIDISEVNLIYVT